MAEEKNFFEALYDVDVRDRMYQKQGLDYIPWATAFSEVAKVFPDVTYEIVKFGESQLPYTESDLGIMVFTRVTIKGVTREMCLPVMDGANKAMKSVEYTYKVKSGEKTVPAATMFDINKTIMRCFAKNLAMFGLGLHLWTKEEAPENVLKGEKKKMDELKTSKDSLIALMGELIENGVHKDDIYAIIAKHNGGKKNPTTIDNIEVCEKAIDDIKKKYKEKK